MALDPKMPTATKDYLDYVKESDIGKAIQVPPTALHKSID